MAKIVFFVLLCGSFYAESNQTEYLLPFVDEKTWIFFNTNHESGLERVYPIHFPESEIQKSAGSILGVTIQTPPISESILKQLAHIGIHFIFTVPERPQLEVQTPIHWEGGVLFLTNFNQRGEIFQKWLEYAHIRPSKIILIDDRKDPLIHLEEEMAKLGVPCTTFHYTKTSERALNPFTTE